ncbi:copper chaperone PCu(A)C [Ramlibacter sp. PS4R-6]|uniref:copper chaperone PCu(A)C n=1 Tax=Ramlibacter sp. PS4R-6 TaxID=3133438 RepID=UPI00309D5E39
MNKTLLLSSLAFCGAASAHVGIDPPVAETGAPWNGVVRIGHGCDAAATTAVELKLPAGVTAVRAQAKAGWQVALTPQQVTWTVAPGTTPDAKDKGDFPLELRVASAPAATWLTAVQRCGATAVEWSQVPAPGASTEGMKTPAVLLQVMAAPEAAAWRMRPVVENAWARATLPGQPTGGAYMRITAKEPTQLVGASSPVAGKAEVHEMKLEGDVMRMRAAGAIELPVGKPFELKPGGHHVMLQELKQPLAAGSTVPVTLVFRNARGVESRTELRVPVTAQPPGGAPAGGHGEHKH